MGNRVPANNDLGTLYRRYTRDGQNPQIPDVDTLLALAEGEKSAQAERLLAEVARSGLHADLLRFTRALAPESARLGVQLEQAFDADRAGHRLVRRAAARQAAAPQRRWLRASASLAAALAVAVAVWSLQHRGTPLPAPPTAATQPGSDRIFAAGEKSTQGRATDEIFRGEFKRDQIFKSEFTGG